MLRLRAGTATLLIGPRAAAGVHGGRYCLESEADIRQRLTTALHDPASREAMRRFWAHWQGDFRISGIKDHSIVDRIARMSVRGPLVVMLVVDTSVRRRDTTAARRKQVTEALQTRTRAMPWPGPVRAPAPITVSMVKPAATQPPTMVDRSVVGGPKRLIGDWTPAEKLIAIIVRTASSKKLSHEAQQQLQQMLKDPAFLPMLGGALLVFFVSQGFVVGEFFDAVLVVVALSGAYFLGYSIGTLAVLFEQFVKKTGEAKDEHDLDEAADILASIIVMIGLAALLALLTHMTTRAISAGLQAKGGSVKLPVQERAAPIEAEPARRGGGTDGNAGASGKGSSKQSSSTEKPSATETPGAAKRPGLRSDLDPKWLNKDGTLKWPENEGFASTPKSENLAIGTKIDRYGADGGSFLSPSDTPYGSRALPYEQSSLKYQQYEVVKELPVKSGEAARWFDQPGGGTQYKTELPVRELVKQGYLREI